MNECQICNVPLTLKDDRYWANFQETLWKCPSCNRMYATYQNKQLSPLKRILLTVLSITEHNKEHFIVLHVAGENVYACSRCLGAYITGLICWLLFGSLYILNIISLPFYFVFIVSFLLGSVTLIDFATVDIFHMRKGSNRVRFIAGAFLGMAAMLYFWLLPTSWLFRIISLLFYNLLAILVAYISVRMRKSHAGEAQVSIG